MTEITTTPLNDATSFTSSYIQTQDFGMIVLSVYSDTSYFVEVLFSNDQTNDDKIVSFQAQTALHLFERVPIRARFYRIRITNNSGGNQTVLRAYYEEVTTTGLDVQTLKTYLGTQFTNQTNSITSAITTGGDPDTRDAFGRSRVSDLYTQFSSKQLSDNDAIFWDDQEVSGASTTSVYSANTSSTVLGVAATTAGYRVRQTYQRFNYQSGKSQLIFLTGVLGNQSGGNIARIGYFDTNNGLFFESSGGGHFVGVRSFTSGSAVDTTIAKASWNVDSFDGAGPSGITIDFTKTQIFVIDFAWLGAGRVRFGFNIQGKTWYAHYYDSANIATQVYMTIPNLPIRYEIENDGNGAASTITQICAAVQTEGGLETEGSLRHIENEDSVAIPADTEVAMIGLRLKTTHLHSVIDIINTTILSVSGNDKNRGYWNIVFNPTVAGTFTYVSLSNSAVQYALGTGSNTVTGGTPVDGGFFAPGEAARVNIPNLLRLGSFIDGTPTTVVLTCRPFASMEANASITWREST